MMAALLWRRHGPNKSCSQDAEQMWHHRFYMCSTYTHTIILDLWPSATKSKHLLWRSFTETLKSHFESVTWPLTSGHQTRSYRDISCPWLTTWKQDGRRCHPHKNFNKNLFSFLNSDELFFNHRLMWLSLIHCFHIEMKIQKKKATLWHHYVKISLGINKASWKHGCQTKNKPRPQNVKDETESTMKMPWLHPPYSLTDRCRDTNVTKLVHNQHVTVHRKGNTWSEGAESCEASDGWG